MFYLATAARKRAGGDGGPTEDAHCSKAFKQERFP